MSLFAAAAQRHVMELTNSRGILGGILDALNVRQLGATTKRASTWWTKLATTLSGIGLAIMDIGSATVNVGWKIVVYGFVGWAGMGLLKNIGMLVGVVGAEVLRAIPQTTPNVAA
jgi:hypothetical protein